MEGVQLALLVGLLANLVLGEYISKQQLFVLSPCTTQIGTYRLPTYNSSGGTIKTFEGCVNTIWKYTIVACSSTECPNSQLRRHY